MITRTMYSNSSMNKPGATAANAAHKTSQTVVVITVNGAAAGQVGLHRGESLRNHGEDLGRAAW